VGSFPTDEMLLMVVVMMAVAVVWQEVASWCTQG